MSNLVYEPIRPEEGLDEEDHAVRVLQWKANQVIADLGHLQDNIEESETELQKMRRKQTQLLAEKQQLEGAIAVLKGNIL